MRPELVELSIESYKNLESIRLPWDSKVVLYGPNGSGKTNVLECLTLLAGTNRATWEAAPRLMWPRAGHLSVLLRVGEWELPGGPRSMDFNWPLWPSLGAESGRTFAEGLQSSQLPDPLRELLIDAAARPLIRYSLVEVKGKLGGAHSVMEISGQYSRQFDRTLCLSTAPPQWLIAQAEALPDDFAPFRTWLATAPNSRSDYPDLLGLPSSRDLPLSVQWIPRLRDGRDQMDALHEARRLATDATAGLLERIAEIEGVGRAIDPGWFVMAFLLDVLADELQHTLPEVSLDPHDDQSMLFDHERWTGNNFEAQTEYLSARTIDLLSDGERIWVDQAIGAAERQLEVLAALQAKRSAFLDRTDLESSAPEVHSAILERSKGSLEDAWAFQVSELLEILDQAMLKEVEEGATQEFRYPGEAVFRRLFWGGMKVIRIFDEPERNQHPLAVRRIAIALDRLHATGTDVVISSHSHVMLDSGIGRYLHLRRTPEGPVVESFWPTELTVLNEISAAMGLTRGELLGLRRLVLLVEGLHDEVVLNYWFGPQLRAAGVLVLPIWGTDNTPGLAQLRLVAEFLDVPVALILDRGRELDAVKALQRSVEKAGRGWYPVELEQADIVYYLPDEGMAAVIPGWPGWTQVKADRPRTKPIKTYISERYGRQLSGRLIEKALKAATEAESPTPRELVRVVSGLTAFADGAASSPHPLLGGK